MTIPLLLVIIQSHELPVSHELSDASGSNYDQAGYTGRPAKRGGASAGGQQRRDRDDKVHDSIIEERIQRERPCRTLFIRNIKASFVVHLDLQFAFRTIRRLQD